MFACGAAIFCPSDQGNGFSYTPANVGSGWSLSNQYRTGSNASSVSTNIRSSVGRADKRYFEVRVDTLSGTSPFLSIGYCLASMSAGAKLGSTTGSVAYGNLGTVLYNAGSIQTYATLTVGDVFMMAVDPTIGSVWFGKNGTWNGSPSAGTGAAKTSGPTGTVYAAAGTDQSGTPTSAGTGRFMAAEQTYAAPAGFTAWGD